MGLAHGIRIGALGIALLVVRMGAPPGARAPQGAPPFNFEIHTLSNRADLISDGDALVEVQVPKTVPMKKVTLTLNGVDVGDRFVADEDARTLRGVRDRHGARREHLRRRRQRQRQRPAVGEPDDHQPRARRADPARLADAALDLRHADAGAGLGQHAGVQRQRPVDLRRRRAVQHRHRVQALLPDDDARLLDRAARPQPAGRAAGQQLLQALHARHDARRPGDHDDDARA